MDDDLTHIGLLDEEDIVLDEAALALALPDHAGADLAPHRLLLAEVASRLAVVGAGARGPGERAAALARVLGAEFGFAGDRETYDDPANADLIRVIERRRGLPVALSILYVAAARRIGWDASALDVPGHVLVLVGEDAAPVIVDPFAGGAAVARERLAALLAAADPAPAAVRHVGTMSNRAVLVRLLMNQAMRAERAGKGRRALALYARMTAVAPAHGPAWWERARLELADDDVPAARASLTAMLEVTREPALRARVADALAALAVD